jgi:transglutaminase-like putative cysteine protease
MGVDDWGYYDADEIREDYAEYLSATERVPLGLPINDFVHVAESGASGQSVSEFIISLNRVLHRVLHYNTEATDVDTPLEDVIKSREGVCQDYAHLMLAVARSKQIPARYVSGYLFTQGNVRQGEDLLAEKAEQELHDLGFVSQPLVSDQTATQQLIDGGAMHAWVECLLPDGKWHGFDPTNCLMTNELYVRVHTGRDYGDVPPMRGVYAGPRATKLEVAVTVTQEG